jgi:hypothetical protein
VEGVLQDEVRNERTCIQDTQERMTGVASPWKSEAGRASCGGVKSNEGSLSTWAGAR